MPMLLHGYQGQGPVVLTSQGRFKPGVSLLLVKGNCGKLVRQPIVFACTSLLIYIILM